VNGEEKKKFIDRLDRAHNQDLRKIVMMKLGKKSKAFGRYRKDENPEGRNRIVYIN
jgi:hypothetical protein